MRFQNNIATGNLDSIEILFADDTPEGAVRFGVYADNGGIPGNLLLDACEVAVADGLAAIDGLSLSVTQDMTVVGNK